MKNRHFYALKQELFIIIILPFEWTIRRAGPIKIMQRSLLASLPVVSQSSGGEAGAILPKECQKRKRLLAR
jgi:hypothetical protein